MPRDSTDDPRIHQDRIADRGPGAVNARPQVAGLSPTLWAAAIVAGILLAIWAGRAGFVTIDLASVSLRQLGELLSAYLVLALLVERAVELILNGRFGADEIAIRTPLRQAAARHEAELRILSRELDVLPEPKLRGTVAEGDLLRSARAARETLPAQAAATRERLEDLSLRKRRWATICSVGLSAALALSGFQILHGAFAAQIALSALPAAQMQLFACVDICLTAVVLAGGAGGIHTIIRRLLNFGETDRTGILRD